MRRDAVTGSGLEALMQRTEEYAVCSDQSSYYNSVGRMFLRFLVFKAQALDS